jgi:DNA-binding winged helix-turn-helix (wHTH) protein
MLGSRFSHPPSFLIPKSFALQTKGEIVSRDELMARLWPGRIVEEGNLHVLVSALRKSLDECGDGHSFVVTVPGRGYRLADPTGLRSVQSANGALAAEPPLPDKPSIAVMHLPT